MTSKSALQHRSWQSASLTDQSCCADNSLTAGMFHWKFTCEVCCSHKGYMTSKSALQHRSCQSASLTNQSCCADNSLTAGMFHCKFTSLLLTQRHYDQQQCTVTAGMFHCKFEVCCSHKGTMTSKSALQHRSWQMHLSLIRAAVQNRAESK